MERIYVRPDRCLGCKTCELQCAIAKSKSKNLLGAIAENPRPKKRLYVEQGEKGKLPIICRHCEDAPCLNACITGCLYQDEQGLIRRHKERCIGCWSCVMTCPYGVITRDPELHIAVKCDRCHKKDIPECVASCPTKALILVDIDRLPKEKRQSVIVIELG